MTTRREYFGRELGEWAVLLILVTLLILIIIRMFAPETPEVLATVDQSKSPSERIPQASVPEVEAFATTFLHQLGYNLTGLVVCMGWTTDGYLHKQYTCYAVYTPTRPPLVLTCGPMTREAVEPLGCTLNPERSLP
jgi:hypothetical protein